MVCLLEQTRDGFSFSPTSGLYSASVAMEVKEPLPGRTIVSFGSTKSFSLMDFFSCSWLRIRIQQHWHLEESEVVPIWLHISESPVKRK